MVQAAGGIHRFMDWDRPILSDSGGFQVWSLIRQDPNRGVIRDNEVIFREPTTGEKWNLTPERSSTSSSSSAPTSSSASTTAPMRRRRSPSRSARSSGRCAGRAAAATSSIARSRSAAGLPPRIFAVVQGGGIEALRRQCAAALAEIGFDGYGFGGWPLAADGSLLAEPMRWVAESLPASVPKHALGIGRPDHVVSAFALGYSVFDCALPTRDARHGRLYAFRAGWARAPPFARRRLLPRRAHPRRRPPGRPRTDRGWLRLPGLRPPLGAYLHHLFKVGDTSAERLATLHNLRFYVRLFALLRTA